MSSRQLPIWPTVWARSKSSRLWRGAGEHLLGLLAGRDGVVPQVDRSPARFAQLFLGPFSLGGFLDDDAQADDLPLGIRDGQPMLQPASRDARLGRRLG